MIHEHLLLPKFFSDVKSGRKTFIVVSKSVKISVGDSCILYERAPRLGFLNSKPIMTKVTYVLPLSEVFFIDSDIVIFAFKLI